MKLVIEVEVMDGLKSTAVAKTEELLIHQLVADNSVVKSAVVMRNTIHFHPLGYQRFERDETTRQEKD